LPVRRACKSSLSVSGIVVDGRTYFGSRVRERVQCRALA
jgi:hypothetical protein